MERIGTDGDADKAWEILQKQQSRCDIIGIGWLWITMRWGLSVRAPETRRLTKVGTLEYRSRPVSVSVQSCNVPPSDTPRKIRQLLQQQQQSAVSPQEWTTG